MNFALRLLLLIWVLGYLFASCGPILNGHLILGAIGVFGGIILFIPWVIGIVVLAFLISATRPAVERRRSGWTPGVRFGISRPALEAAVQSLGRAGTTFVEGPMNAFLVDLEDKPGALADVAEALGAKGINIEMVTGATCGGSGRAVIGTNDGAATRTTLQGLGATFTEAEPVEVNLRHEPGSLGRAARRLADAGINIEAMMPTGMSGGDVTVAFVTNDPAKTREILSAAGSVA